MSDVPIITGKLRLKDETAAGLDSAEANIAGRMSTMSSVAGGIIQAEFSRNIVRALKDVSATSIEAAAAFESATERIIAASGLTAEEAELLRMEIQSAAHVLGVEFGTGATAAMLAIEALVKAGLEGEEATVALAGVLQLARIEGINTADAANMMVAALAQFGLEASDATRIVDGFVKSSAAGIDTATGYALGLANVGATAAQMGFSLEETLAALVQIDASQKDAAKSGTFLNRALLNLVEKADELGLSIYDSDGSMKSLDEIIGQVRDTLEGFGEDQEAANEWLGMFDTRAQRAILALANYDETVGETEGRLIGMSSAQDQVNIVMDTYAGKMGVVHARQEDAAISAGKYTTQLSLMSAEMTASLGPVGLFANALGPPMLTGVMQGLTVAAIPKLVGMLSSAGPLGIALAVGAVAVGIFALAWQNNWGGIRDSVAKYSEQIQTALKGLHDWLNDLGDAWRDFWGIAKKEAEEGAEEITEAIEKIEMGESPGGLRSAITALGEFSSAMKGLKETSLTGGAPIVIGPIYVAGGDLGSEMGRGLTARSLVEEIGKELIKLR